MRQSHSGAGGKGFSFQIRDETFKNKNSKLQPSGGALWLRIEFISLTNWLLQTPWFGNQTYCSAANLTEATHLAEMPEGDVRCVCVCRWQRAQKGAASQVKSITKLQPHQSGWNGTAASAALRQELPEGTGTPSGPLTEGRNRKEHYLLYLWNKNKNTTSLY